MINPKAPTNWQDLQNQVARILSECGFEVEVEKDIVTSRDTVNIDVFAIDKTIKPATSYLCECKHWNTAAPKTIVHAFRTVVNDYGANYGFIISSNGFQQGAYSAAQYTNIQLLTWEQFEDLFVDKWYERYFTQNLTKAVCSLVNVGGHRVNIYAVYKFYKNRSSKLRAFHKRFEQLADFAWSLCEPFTSRDGKPIRLELPLANDRAFDNWLRKEAVSFPQAILDAESLRELLEVYTHHLTQMALEFEEIVNGR